MAGNYTLSSFNFASYGLRQINVYINGQPVLGNPIYVSSNVTTGVDIVEPMLWILKSYGKWGKDAGNQLSVADIDKDSLFPCSISNPLFRREIIFTFSKKAS